MSNLDVNVINLSVLKQHHSNFISEKNKFNKMAYSNFNNSYLNRCTDRYVKKLATKINNLYTDINDFYAKIDNWWSSYNSDVENLENYITGTSTSGSFKADGLRVFASSALKELPDYENDYQEVYVDSVDVNTENTFNPYEDPKNQSALLYINNLIGGAVNTSIPPMTAENVIASLSEEQLEELEKYQMGAANMINGNVNVTNLSPWDTKEYQAEEKQGFGAICATVGTTVGTTIAPALTSLAEGICDVGEGLCDMFLYVADLNYQAQASTYNSSMETSATIQLGLVTLTEGIGLAGEAFYDGFQNYAALNYAAQANAYNSNMVMTGHNANQALADSVSEVFETTREEVEKQYVKDSFNKFFEDNYIGQHMWNNSYYPELIRSVFNEVGYFGTYAVGGALLAPVTGGSSLAAPAITASLAAVGGSGRYSEQAWLDGAGTTEGLAYGTFRGWFDAAEVLIGAGISKFQLGKFVTPKASALTKQVINTGAHVILDGADAAMSAKVDPYFQMIYITEEMGAEIIGSENPLSPYYGKKWEDLTFNEKYDALYEYNGGDASVLVQALTGAILSGVSEIGDLGKAKKVDLIAKQINTLDTVNEELLGDIFKLNSQNINELVTQLKNGKNLSKLVDNLDSKQMATIVNALDASKAVELISLNPDVAMLDNMSESQLKNLYVKLSTAENLDEYTEAISKKLDDNVNNSTLKIKELIDKVKHNVSSKVPKELKYAINNIKDNTSRFFKTVTGTVGIIGSMASMTSNPAFIIPGAGILTPSVKLLQDGITGNMVKDSSFIIHRNQKMVINGTILKVDMLTQSLPDSLKVKLETNKFQAFSLQAINAFQQLPVQRNGVDIAYGTKSQKMTKMMLEVLEKNGYIKDLQIEGAGKSNLAMERLFMGVKNDKPADMYNMTFKLTDKKIDSESFDKLKKKLRIDDSDYITKVDKNGNTIYLRSKAVDDLLKNKPKAALTLSKEILGDIKWLYEYTMKSDLVQKVNAKFANAKSLFSNSTKELDDNADIGLDKTTNSTSNPKVTLQNTKGIASLNNISLIKNGNNLFLKTKESIKNFIGKFKKKQIDTPIINENKEVENIIDAINKNGINEDILEKISQIEIEDLAQVIDKLYNFSYFKFKDIAALLSNEQLKSLGDHINSSLYGNLIDSSNPIGFVNYLSNSELQKVIDSVNYNSTVYNFLVREYYQKIIDANMKSNEIQDLDKLFKNKKVNNDEEYILKNGFVTTAYNLNSKENLTVQEIIDLFKDDKLYNRLSISELKDKVKYGMAVNQVYNIMETNGYDFGLSVDRLLKLKNFGDTYGNRELAVAMIKNNYLNINLFAKGHMPVEISTAKIYDIISDENVFNSFKQYKYGTEDYKKLFGEKLKLEYISGLEQVYEMAQKGTINLKLTEDQINKCNVLFDAYALNRIKDLNDWFNSDMITILQNKLGNILESSKFEKLKNTATFLDKETFRDNYKRRNNIEIKDNWVAYNSSSEGNVMSMEYSDKEIKHNCFHESIHELSRELTRTGFKIEEKYTGINEATTELIAKYVDGDYETGCGYDPAVLQLRKILDMGIEGVNEQSLLENYFVNNDPLKFLENITKITDEKFTEKLVQAFYESTENNNSKELSKLVTKLAKTVGKEQK